MDNIIDITKKLKKEPKDEPGYYTNLKGCLERENQQGYCACDRCLFKRSVSENLVKQIQETILDKMYTTKEDYYWGDCLEIALLSVILLKEICKQDET